VEKIFNNKRKEEKKVTHVGNLLNNDVLIKKVTAFVVIFTLVSSGYFVGKGDVHPVQIVKSVTSGVIDDVTTTTDNLLTLASNYLLVSASSLRSSVDQNAKYVNIKVGEISDSLHTSASNAKLSLASGAKYFNKSTNKIISNTKIEITNQVSAIANALNYTKTQISNQLLSSASSLKSATASNAKYLNTKVNEVSDNFLTSASSLKSATASNAKYFGNSLNKASASVLTSITSATKELINKTAQSVNNTVDSIFELFNKQPQDETPILVEETKEIQKEDKVAEEQTTKESIVKETSVQPQPKVSASSGSASGGDEPRAQVIERVVQTKEILTVGGITLQDLELAIQQSQNKIYSDMSSLTSANETRIINNYTNVSAPTNKIDKLGHVTISNSTISGTLSGLTDAHIPNDITASNYLPLSGGTLTGALALDSLSLSNTLTVNGVSTFSSFSATSTTASSTIAHGLNVLAINQTGTATSTFAQGIDLANGCFSVNGTCVGGDNALWTDNGSYLTTAGGEFIDVSYFVATSTTASTFPYASSTSLTVSGSTYLGTLTGSLQAIDGLVSASSSLSSAYIEDVYLRNDTNDTTTGILTASSYLSSGSGTSTLANLWANIFQVGSLIETPYFNATSTTASSTIAHGLNVLAINQTGTATSTFAQGIDLANGCFSVNGTCVGGGSGGVGSGTQGQLAFYDSAGTNLTATSTLFLTQTGNFGLGTTSPYAKLSVEMGVGDTGVMFAIASSTNGTATTTHFIVSESGNVGIGTSSPYAALSVEGSSVLGNSALAGYFTATSTTATSTFMGIFSIGSTTPAATALFSVGTSSPLLYIDKITGNVGVGSSGGSDRQLEVLATGDAQLRLSQDSTTYTDFVVAPTTGDLTINMYPNSSANDIILAMPGGSTGANLWICEGTACPSTTFSGGGNLFVEGDIKYATSSRKTYRSIILTSAGAVVPTSGGAAKTQVDGTNHSYYVLDFDATSDEASYWQWTMPDSYDGGTIDITYYWEAGSTSSDVVWCFQTAGIQSNNTEDIDPSLSSAVCETDTAQGNANDLASVEETDATSGFVAGDYVSFKVFRDADNGSDTMSGDARLVKVKIEYGVDQESD